jgi:hypothetical protein
LGKALKVLSLRRSDGVILIDERILGVGDFVERIFGEAEEKIRYQFASQDRGKRMEENSKIEMPGGSSQSVRAKTMQPKRK